MDFFISFKIKKGSREGLMMVNVAHIIHAFYRRAGSGLASSHLDIKTLADSFEIKGGEADKVWSVLSSHIQLTR